MKNTRLNCKILLLALCAALLLTGCAAAKRPDGPAKTEPSEQDLEKHQKQVYAMDTIMILTAYGPNAAEALDAAEERILALEADFDPASETGSIHALNAAAGGRTAVSEDALSLIRTSMYWWEATDGALDPGLYPLSKAWGFIGGEYRVPDSREILSLLARKQTGSLLVDEKAGEVSIPAGMEVGFGAVAKGYTAQAVVDLLRDMGVTSAILSLGGNVQTLGDTKPDGSAWKVAVQDPEDTGSYVGVLSVGEAAVVTSGGYQRYFEQDGVTYIHILDPETGRPVDNDLTSVTVVTEDGASADALSTSLFVMGSEKALAFQKEQGSFEMVLITKDGEVLITEGLAEMFQESGTEYRYVYLE